MKKHFIIICSFILTNIYSQKTTTRTSCLINGPTEIVAGTIATFTSNNLAQCSECYDWDINNDNLSTDNNIVGNLQIVNSDKNQSVTIKAISPGAFSVTLRYITESQCHECTITGDIVDPFPPTPLPKENCFRFDPPNVNDINEFGQLLYQGFIGGSNTPLPSVGLTFKWYFYFEEDGIVEFNEQNPTFRTNCNNPVMSFALKVSNGVQTKIYNAVNPAYPIPGFSVSNTPTCFTHHTCAYGSGLLGDNNFKTNKIKVFPNPTNSKINFEGKNLKEYSLKIFNSEGIELINKENIESEIDLNQLKKGIYIYHLEHKNGEKEIGKLIKE
jgi:hypothetical protein